MNLRFKPYTNYRNSGIDWIGKVPSHWRSMRFKNLIRLKTELSSSNLKIGLENIESQTGKFIKTDSVFEGDGVAFKPGDIVYGKLRPYLQKVWLAEFEGNAVGDFFVFEHKDNSLPEYLKYLFLSNGFTNEVNSSTEGAKMPRVASRFILNLPYFLPPIEEQSKIASWLDGKVGQIDATVAEKEAMVADIQNYRQSIISEAVTRGLNHDASLRPSGIDWIGDIPEHWNVIPLKYLLKETMMYGANEIAEDVMNVDHPRYIRITDISEDGKLKSDTYKTLSPQKAEPYLLEVGDILFARSGATVGKTYRFNETYPCCFAGYLIKASCAEKLYSKFLLYYTNSTAYNNWKDSIYDQSTIPNISADKYNKLPIPIPPLPEQRAIAEFLDKKAAVIDELLSNLHEQIADLRSYKASLISEAVTGKVDLRDWEPQN